MLKPLLFPALIFLDLCLNKAKCGHYLLHLLLRFDDEFCLISEVFPLFLLLLVIRFGLTGNIHLSVFEKQKNDNSFHA